MVKRLFIQFLKLFLFWIFIFDFQKILFSIHNWDKFSGISFSEYLGAYFYSFKLDLGTAGALSVLPAIFLAIRLINNQKWIKSAEIHLVKARKKRLQKSKKKTMRKVLRNTIFSVGWILSKQRATS